MKTLFRNGSIHTMNGTEVVHSLLVEDGRILDVNCDVPAGECQVVDLHGKTVLPGFHDSHEHFLCYATDKEKINFFGIRSLEEMAERTRRYIADRGIKKGEWIQGGGWNENEFDVPVLPSRQDLDKFCPDNPAIFTRTCCSVAVANTAALKAAGIFDDIPTLQDGHIVVDENGVPTGQSVPRTTAHAEGLRHRTSHVWIVRRKNGRVQVLLQMRCAAKDSYPGCYDISSAGHIPGRDRRPRRPARMRPAAVPL